jgi:hypothetical protein
MATKKKTATKVAPAAKAKGKDVDAFGNTWAGALGGTREEVGAVEAALGVKLSDELAAFLQECANGKPARGFYFSKAHEIEVGLGRVLPLQDQPKMNGIVTDASMRRRVTGMPEHFVPFAVDNGNSDVLCVDTKTQQIVYWVHDGSPDDRGQVAADSLKTFIARLEEPPY